MTFCTLKELRRPQTVSISAQTSFRAKSGPRPVRVRLDRVAHRPVFLRIARRRLDRVSIRLRVFHRRLLRLGGLRTLVWNGPLGAFETPPFDAGTVAFARAVAAATKAGGLRSVAGGGDTVAALRHAGVLDQLSYVSTAGGAFLEWLEGKTLPGVAALEA